MKFGTPGRMMQQVFASIFKKPATIRYPFVKSKTLEGFRGQIAFDSQKCVGCKICMKDCPSGAITIKEVGDKKFQAEFNLGKCIFCGQCVDSCFKKAVQITKAFELAELDNSKLTVTFNAEPQKNTEDKP